MDEGPNPKRLLTLARMRMPFGRYAGRLLIDLPEPYVVWFHKTGYPTGSIGSLLRDLYEIKLNGLESLLDPFRLPEDGPPPPPDGTRPRRA